MLSCSAAVSLIGSAANAVVVSLGVVSAVTVVDSSLTADTTASLLGAISLVSFVGASSAANAVVVSLDAVSTVTVVDSSLTTDAAVVLLGLSLAGLSSGEETGCSVMAALFSCSCGAVVWALFRFLNQLNTMLAMFREGFGGIAALFWGTAKGFAGGGKMRICAHRRCGIIAVICGSSGGFPLLL